MGRILIKNIELKGTGEARFPLSGDGEICIVLDRTGHTVLDVPRKSCLRGRVAGVLSLTGTGDVSLCGTLQTYRLDRELLSGVFEIGQGVLVVRPVYTDMGYLSKRFVATSGPGNGTASTSTWGVIQDVRDASNAHS